VVPGKLATALEWNEKLRAQTDVAAVHAVLAAADAVCNEAMQMTVSVPEKMSGQVARVRFVVEQFRSVCSSHMRSLAGAGEGEKP